ncbi:MAG: hypothetical protein AAF212_11930, partial [Verrucomicrobiota bacterium]
MPLPINQPDITNYIGFIFRSNGSLSVKDSGQNNLPIDNISGFKIKEGRSLKIEFILPNSGHSGGILVAPLGWHTKCKGGGMTLLGDVNFGPVEDSNNGPNLTQSDRLNTATVMLHRPLVGKPSIHVHTSDING